MRPVTAWHPAESGPPAARMSAAVPPGGPGYDSDDSARNLPVPVTVNLNASVTRRPGTVSDRTPGPGDRMVTPGDGPSDRPGLGPAGPGDPVIIGIRRDPAAAESDPTLASRVTPVIIMMIAAAAATGPDHWQVQPGDSGSVRRLTERVRLAAPATVTVRP